MRLQAEVEILNRDFNTKTKPLRSSIAIGLKPSVKKDQKEIFIVISTAQNRTGNRFVIRNEDNLSNVEQIFDKFVSEGKVTLRLKVPARDLCIRKADPLQLKGFMNLMRAGLAAKTQEQIDKLSLTSSAFSSTATTSKVTKPKSKLVITDKKDYPITTNFPHTLETLTITGINLKKMDTRFMKLKLLGRLDLSNNAIKDISVFGNKSINLLDNLKELVLANNSIEVWPPVFCANHSIQTNLRLLDLSGNKFKSVPFNVYRLSNLVTLKLSINPELSLLPPTVGQICRTLKKVDIDACPKLTHLPGSVSNWRLDSFSVSVAVIVPALQILDDESRTILSDTLSSVPSLTDLCCVKVLPKIGQLSEEDLPLTLLEKLETMQKCFCHNYVHRSSCLVGLSQVNSSRITRSLEVPLTGVGSHSASLACKAVFCSKKCFQRFSKNTFAL